MEGTGIVSSTSKQTVSTPLDSDNKIKTKSCQSSKSSLEHEDEFPPKLQHKDSGQGISLEGSELSDSEDKNKSDESLNVTESVKRSGVDFTKMCTGPQSHPTLCDSEVPLRAKGESPSKPDDVDGKTPTPALECSSVNHDKLPAKLEHKDSGQGKSLTNGEVAGIDDEKDASQEHNDSELSKTEKQTLTIKHGNSVSDGGTVLNPKLNERSFSMPDSGIEKMPSVPGGHFNFHHSTSERPGVETDQASHQQSKAIGLDNKDSNCYVAASQTNISDISNQSRRSLRKSENVDDESSFYLDSSEVKEFIESTEGKGNKLQDGVDQNLNNHEPSNGGFNGISDTVLSPPASQLVSKQIFDQVVKELEKTKENLEISEFMKHKLERDLFQSNKTENQLKDTIKTLMDANKNLMVKICQQNQMISTLQGELQEKQRELQKKEQDVETLKEQCEQLERSTNFELQKERDLNKNLRESIEEERKRFVRDEKHLKNKVKDLEKKCAWLRESKSPSNGGEMKDLAESLNPSVRIRCGNDATNEKTVYSGQESATNSLTETVPKLVNGSTSVAGNSVNMSQTSRPRACPTCHRQREEFLELIAFDKHVERCHYKKS